MPAIDVTVIGNLTADPELTFTTSGRPVARLTVASNERFRDQSGEWKDGTVSFINVNAWGHLGEHAAESLGKGDRVIVSGIIRQRSYETKEGEKRTVFEVTASEIGAALSYATVKVSRVKRDSVPLPDDPWGGAGQPDEAPF